MKLEIRFVNYYRKNRSSHYHGLMPGASTASAIPSGDFESLLLKAIRDNSGVSREVVEEGERKLLNLVTSSRGMLLLLFFFGKFNFFRSSSKSRLLFTSRQ